MILFDCSELRHAHTGISVYSKSLAAALIGKIDSSVLEMYVPRAFEGCFGDGVKYRFMSELHRYLYLPHKLDLLHIPTQFSKFLPVFHTCPVLLTIHDLNYLHGHFSERKLYKFMKRTLKSMSHCDRIVTISNFAKQDIEEHLDLGGRQVDVVYNGVDYFKGEPQKPQNPPQGEFILAVGRVVLQKNFNVLPCLLEGNDYRLVIVGNLDKRFTEPERILREARKWGVEDRIIFTGGISDAELDWYYRNCSAFVFPSLCEGFGLPPIEAMHYGKPVFLSDRTSLPEIAGEHAYYFNHNFDRRAMQQEFEAGMAHFARGERDIEAMKAHADSFTWDKAANEYVEIYRDMLGW